MKSLLSNLLLLLSSIQVVRSQSRPACPLYTWQCNNGQCIKSEDLCDGNYDCVDRSDETVAECLLRPCPSYAFQCTYGACITGNFKCDGVINCVDESDENRYLCQPYVNYETEMQGRCSIPNSMECRSGECISSDRLCDGHTDCRDGSDETVEVCSFLKCPEYSFRCGYGACVPGVAACDGFKDCRDGSDELANICSNITSTSTIIEWPITEATTSATTTPTILSTTNATASEYPASSAKPISAEKHCSPTTLMRGISSVASCFYKNRSVSCEQDLRAGTIANVSCALGYEKQTKRNLPILKCDVDGEWTRPKTKCIPKCGTLTEEQKDNPSKPWEVTILRRDYAPIYMPICSGVVVSPKIVLTAASCFLGYFNAYYTDHIFYSLIEGFYNKSYRNGDRINAKVHNISSISVKNIHRTQDLAVLVLVNYFQFGYSLKPICLPTAQSNVFPFFDDVQLNIGRPIVRDTTKIYLEYLIANIENKDNGRKNVSYVNIYHFIPFINREIKKYEYLL